MGYLDHRGKYEMENNISRNAGGSGGQSGSVREMMVQEPHLESNVTIISRGRTMDNAADGVLAYNIKAPEDFGSLLSIDIVMFNGNGSVAGNVDISLVGNYGEIGELITNHSDQMSHVAVPVNGTGYELDSYTTSLTMAGLTSNDHIRFYLSRFGSTGIDTFLGPFGVIGIKIRYVVA